ncbi:MAG: SMI1/KNR4 family protein [Bordetella sp.]|nr:SMI1/KNR4 family protein [Bordetella sp.]
MNLSRYQHLVIRDPAPAPTSSELAHLTSLLGADLPDSFLKYLKVANGGYLEYSIEIESGSEIESVSFCGLLSTNASAGEAFEHHIALWRKNIQMPLGILPFAHDGGGSTVFLDLTSAGRGRVVAYVHGLPEWAGKRADDRTLELASSFDKYVAKLQVDREALLDHLAYDVTTIAELEDIREFIELAIPTWQDDSEMSGAILQTQQAVSTNSR